jgi:hypothetical protein
MNRSNFNKRLAILGQCDAFFLALILVPSQPIDAVYVGPIPNMSIKVGLILEEFNLLQ